MPIVDLMTLSESALELEPLSPTVTKLAALAHDDDVDLPEIVAIIGVDPALSFRLLRLANSAAFGAIREIGTIDEAVVRLGRSLVTALAVGASAQRRLAPALPGYGLAEGALFRQAVCASLAAHHLRTISPRDVSTQAPTTALLKDVGKLVLARYLDPNLVRVLEEASASQSRLTAEREVLDTDHAEVGALVAQQWGLPTMIVQAIAVHHAPDELGGGDGAIERMAWTVYLAGIVADRLGAGEGVDPVCPGRISMAMGALAIDASKLARVEAQVDSALVETLSSFSSG